MLTINIFQMMLMPLNMLPWALSGIKRAKEVRDALREQLETEDVISTKVVREEEAKEPSVNIRPGKINCYDEEVNLKAQGTSSRS